MTFYSLLARWCVQLTYTKLAEAVGRKDSWLTKRKRGQEPGPHVHWRLVQSILAKRPPGIKPAIPRTGGGVLNATPHVP